MNGMIGECEVKIMIRNNRMRLLLSSPGDDPTREMHPLVTAIFGATAGAASVFGNTPLDVVKTRMQVGTS